LEHGKTDGLPEMTFARKWLLEKNRPINHWVAGFVDHGRECALNSPAVRAGDGLVNQSAGLAAAVFETVIAVVAEKEKKENLVLLDGHTDAATANSLLMVGGFNWRKKSAGRFKECVLNIL